MLVHSFQDPWRYQGIFLLIPSLHPTLLLRECGGRMVPKSLAAALSDSEFAIVKGMDLCESNHSEGVTIPHLDSIVVQAVQLGLR